MALREVPAPADGRGHDALRSPVRERRLDAIGGRLDCPAPARQGWASPAAQGYAELA